MYRCFILFSLLMAVAAMSGCDNSPSSQSGSKARPKLLEPAAETGDPSAADRRTVVGLDEIAEKEHEASMAKAGSESKDMDQMLEEADKDMTVDFANDFRMPQRLKHMELSNGKVVVEESGVLTVSVDYKMILPLSRGDTLLSVGVARVGLRTFPVVLTGEKTGTLSARFGPLPKKPNKLIKLAVEYSTPDGMSASVERISNVVDIPLTDDIKIVPETPEERAARLAVLKKKMEVLSSRRAKIASGKKDVLTKSMFGPDVVGKDVKPPLAAENDQGSAVDKPTETPAATDNEESLSAEEAAIKSQLDDFPQPRVEQVIPSEAERPKPADSKPAGETPAGSNGTGSNGTGSNGTGSNGTGSNGTGSNGTGSNGTGSNGTGSAAGGTPAGEAPPKEKSNG